MKHFTTYLAEEAILMADVKKALTKKLGFKDIKDVSKKTIAVLVKNGSAKGRIDALEKIQAHFAALGAMYNQTPTGASSVGKIQIGPLSILAKPLSKQGNKSPGVGNEHVLVNAVNEIIQDNGPMDVIFKSGRKKFTMKLVREVISAGTDTAGRKKSDVNFMGKKVYPCSIKKDGAEIWESADSFWGKKARTRIDRLLAQGKIELKNIGSGKWKITPQFAVKATPKEQTNVIFGSDILGKGTVVARTFRGSDFVYDGKKNTLTINVSHLITSLKDLTAKEEVWFLVRNDKTRPSIAIGYPGLRVLAVFGSRINKNVLRTR